MNKLKLEILSLEGIVFNEEIICASFFTVSGIISVLLGHVNLMTRLIAGEIVIEGLSGMKRIVTSSGFVEIDCNNINVIAEFAAYANKANEQKIRQVIELAKGMRNKSKRFAKTLIC
jgi:F-type H+-transporting ATPase subunit epsilon